MLSLNKNSKFKIVLLACLAVVIIAFSFLPALSNGWVNWDDDEYVIENTAVQNFSLQSLKKVFTSYFAGNYQPLTILSYLLEYKLFALEPFGYHLTNLVLHLFNCLLVFWLFYLLSRETAVALIIMLLFGLHPLHVESVAWISQRKDLLYSFFFLTAIINYIYYRQRKNNKQYYLCVILFLLALLSKPMAVTLPLVLLLLDYLLRRKFNPDVFKDKIPFFILSLIFGTLAVISQYSSGAIRIEKSVNFFYQVKIAGYSIIFYLQKIFIPIKLSCLYPYPELGDSFSVFYSFLGAAILFSLVIISGKYTRKVLFGCGFFLVSLTPVLQFIPVGNTVVADRYAYIASLGIFYILAEGIFWWLSRRSKQSRLKQSLILLTLIFIFGLLAGLSWQRCRVWKDSKTLWDDVLSRHPAAAIALNNRGRAYQQSGDLAAALSDYNRAIKINPRYKEVFNNRGVIYKQQRNMQQALSDYTRAIEISPDYADSYYNRGNLYRQQGNLAAALADYNRAIKINPGYAQAFNNRGLIYYQQGNFSRSISDYSRSIAIDNNYMPAYFNRMISYYAVKEYALARADLDKVKRLGYTVDPGMLAGLAKISGVDK